MYEELQFKDKEHSPILFHHSVIKTIVLHPLVEKGVSWEAFLETTLKWHEANVESQSPSVPKQQIEVGSSSKSVEKTQRPKPQMTKVYKRG